MSSAPFRKRRTRTVPASEQLKTGLVGSIDLTNPPEVERQQIIYILETVKAMRLADNTSLRTIHRKIASGKQSSVDLSGITDNARQIAIGLISHILLVDCRVKPSKALDLAITAIKNHQTRPVTDRLSLEDRYFGRAPSANGHQPLAVATS